MSHRMRRLLLGATLAIAVLPLVAGDGTVDLEGGFVWEREGETHEGALKAVLTPTGEGAWDVAFHFDWEDGPHVYKGTCRGSLDGELAGDVTADGDREMNFKFRGSFKDGRFAGTHAFVTSDGEEQSSGTLTLAAPGKG